ncbi:MAG: acyltransferase [Bacteroidota bacterium]
MLKHIHKKYFYGLDALRGIAALLVVFNHVPEIIKGASISSFNSNLGFLAVQGENAVTFFFVLSGFLITYLILEEEKNKGSISIKKFYLRRVLRIWPVYYLMTFVGFLGSSYLNQIFYEFPSDAFNSSSFTYYLFLLPNIPISFPAIAGPSNPLAFQSWSIGVEEQFYLFWPWIFILIRSNKFRLIALATIYLGLPAIKISPNIFTDVEFLQVLKRYFVFARFDNMALGGILGYLVYFNAIKIKKSIQVVSHIILASFMIFIIELPMHLETMVYPILWCVLIYSIINSTQKNSFLEGRVMKYLGSISYGVYMYHVVAIYLVQVIINRLNILSSDNVIVINILSVIFTIIISAISYELMEKKFLKLKKTFS